MAKLKVGDVVIVLSSSKFWGDNRDTTEQFMYSTGVVTGEVGCIDCVHVEISSHHWDCSIEDINEFGFATCELEKIGVLGNVK